MKQQKVKVEVPENLRTQAISQVMYANSALAQWERMAHLYSEDKPNRPASVTEAFTVVRNWLIEKELKAYRNLFMTVSVWGDTEDQAARRLAIKRFLQEDMTIAHFWTSTGELPYSWLKEDEAMIRECIAEVERGLTGKRKYTRKKFKESGKDLTNKVRE